MNTIEEKRNENFYIAGCLAKIFQNELDNNDTTEKVEFLLAMPMIGETDNTPIILLENLVLNNNKFTKKYCYIQNKNIPIEYILMAGFNLKGALKIIKILSGFFQSKIALTHGVQELYVYKNGYEV